MPDVVVEGHYREQAALAALVARRVGQLWSRVSPADVGAWAALSPQAVSVVVSGQLVAAQAAEGYVAASLGVQGVRVAADAVVAPAGFAGMSNLGVPVAEVLDAPRVRALTAIGAGAPPRVAVEAAGRGLQSAAVSLVQDAGRQADSVAIAARPRVGWTRMVQPPCCSKCAVLAGRFYRFNDGFQRHPRCDCRHIPAVEDTVGSVSTDPSALFGSGQVTGLRVAQARAIGDGADPAQVVNADRGRSRDGMSTTESTTRRGVGRGRRGVRLTPDAIYAQAGSRDEALELLRANGYVR